MALGNTEAEACAQEIIDSIDGFSPSQILDKSFMWKEVMKILYSRIKADAEVITVVTGTLPDGPVAAAGEGGLQ